MRMQGEPFRITLDKGLLIEKITENRDAHRAIFERAQERYRAKLIAILDERLAAARRGSKVDHYIRIPVPVDYTNEYDAALEALSWELNKEVILDQAMFNRLVRNDWEWAADFVANTQSYIAE